MRDQVLTAGSVTAGHPDKLCDRISDAIVDAHLAQGLRSGVVAECAVATGVLFVSVRAAEPGAADAAAIARRLLAEAGYGAGQGAETATVVLDAVAAEPLPPGPARARHMTTAFGHACGETAEAMPFPIWAAHRLARALDAARAEDRIPWLSPDAQAQVAVRMAGGRPAALEAVALTFGTAAEAPRPGADEMEAELLREVVAPALAPAAEALRRPARLVLAPMAGPGGPAAHSGLTGRKTADDAYGAHGRRGGAALSGKDPARIDRIAAYAARHAARAARAAGLAEEIEVELSYLIGDEAPASLSVETGGTGAVPDETIAARLSETLDMRVGAIAERFGLWELPAARGGAFYGLLAAYGQIGRDDLAAPWEDVAEAAARLA